MSVARRMFRIAIPCSSPSHSSACWRFFAEALGPDACVMDGYGQTETAGLVLLHAPSAWRPEPGTVGAAFFGVRPALVDDEGREVAGPSVRGHLVLRGAFPGMARTVAGDHARFEKYYSEFSGGVYSTGDGAERASSGFFKITGRLDDGERISCLS